MEMDEKNWTHNWYSYTTERWKGTMQQNWNSKSIRWENGSKNFVQSHHVAPTLPLLNKREKQSGAVRDWLMKGGKDEELRG